MNRLLWIPCATIILRICIVQVRTFKCDITPCSLPNFCGSGRECNTYADTCQTECVCKDNVTHELCRGNEVKLTTNSTVTFSGTLKKVGPGDTAIPLTQNADCLNNYTLNTTLCQGGMPCFYGDCVTDNMTSITRCECFPGAVGDLCNEPCCLDCGPHGECSVNITDNSQLCICHPDYTDERCETLKPIAQLTSHEVQVEKVTWLWLIGVCAMVLFLLLLLLIVLPYLMWKHRVILIMKIVHYFQPYEDQDDFADDRVWDAFVSYRSDPVDEEFVLRKLFPTLEKKMGFKVNIHFKDFAVGETIANNIIQAVQNSRRTILVISKNYVKSEFTRFEYQCAQQEMLQKKHRIIPILLEDITEIKDTFDPTLKIILNSVTYIVWPGENSPKDLQKFWKRLELSMPKMRKIKDEGTKVKEDATLWPESIAIHMTGYNKHSDIFNSAESKSIHMTGDNKHSDIFNRADNKSVDEGQQHKVMTSDLTDHFGTNTLNKRLSMPLPEFKL